ncbi:carbohydrate-binding module family 20 protein [Macrolepiota fuliginosa MF-IS2]|uniref:Glucoamylase n=1 Tax=Macrolepiota fuliginosa MF-IS2 TaxID=1400762 RepID=A0A9P5XQH9_9AGAR|nr:carbohydrate-binding module family 20 protein [Macrolepiota fuliginosa MF-IS2]
MRSLLFAAFCFAAGCTAQLASVDTYLSTEVPAAKAGLLANIGPSGSKSSGAKAGVIIASPSTSNPDYLYTWTRDAALVFKTLTQLYASSQDATLRTTLDDYVAAQTTLQQVSNPSGTVSTGGLGEPKFNVNLTAFTGAWGRPQRDGPALRATALIQYANWLISNGNTSYVTSKVWPVVKLDLDYTANYWNQSGFDLWEEVNSSSFFTTAAQLRALHEGATLATKLGQTSSASSYNAQIPNVYCFLQSYWNPTDKYVTSNTGGGRSGKDANSIIASIHTFDAAAGCDVTTFQPCSDKALANHKAYVDSFRSIYSINSGFASNAAVATGRYPEDVYYDGNPWYLTTFAAAEQLYDALTVWKSLGALNITSTSLAFFQQFSPSVTTGTYSSSSSTYTSLTSAIRNYADGFLAIAAEYTPSNGALAEQYEKKSGTPLSAADLTWSYAALVTANNARSGYTQASWGASGLTLPGTCVGNSGPTVAVTFNENASTVFGENIYITGSIDALSNWSTGDSLLLSSANYPVWSLTVNIPASTSFEYKYIRINNGSVTWESDPNRSYTTGASGSATIGDTWR